MDRPLTDHPFAQQEQEPDQIDMMNESELREELRKVVNDNIALRAVYEAAKDVGEYDDYFVHKPAEIAAWKRMKQALAAVQTRQCRCDTFSVHGFHRDGCPAAVPEKLPPKD